MLPSILAKQLEKGIGDYVETTFPMINEQYTMDGKQDCGNNLKNVARKEQRA
jgi:hypothetical protein